MAMPDILANNVDEQDWRKIPPSSALKSPDDYDSQGTDDDSSSSSKSINTTGMYILYSVLIAAQRLSSFDHQMIVFVLLPALKQIAK